MRSTGPDLKTFLDVVNRDGHACVRDGTPLRGEKGRDFVLHHRRPRAMGGSKRTDTNSPCNLLSLCTPCHLHVESNRAEAIALGWLVPQGRDPAQVTVLVEHGSRWVYLTDDAQYADAPPAGAA